MLNDCQCISNISFFLRCQLVDFTSFSPNTKMSKQYHTHNAKNSHIKDTIIWPVMGVESPFHN